MENLKIIPNEDYIDSQINNIVEKLCQRDSYKDVFHHSIHGFSMPSVKILNEIVELLRIVLFPGYFGNSEFKPRTMQYFIGSTLEKVYKLLNDQIRRGFCFDCHQENNSNLTECEDRGVHTTQNFFNKLLDIRLMLAKDVDSAYEGDPAAKSKGEAIFCYPSIRALVNYRIAHELYKLGVQIIPRIITESAHSETGIDIHPGAQIGERFFIDHGTGVVIGETCRIGNNVRLYQGVTLGAVSFPKDEKGNPIKGKPRHPVVEDNVTIYSGATLLGRITIGHGSVIGGNVWLTHSIPPGSKILQGNLEETLFENGLGI